MKMIVNLQQDRPDFYKARCPALPGCVATGKTSQEALHNIETAIRGYLASLGTCMPMEVKPQVVGA